ncbi:putative PIN family toxin of toxin-antitoxin system [Silvibacterium bohemicum]|uniref:Putative PIN family toxin of toxin-antitoxin system n=1 Tax=Silvibacterium bohemicum TaxID=1577686 RepID=A0A841K4D7_9BACT|nr:putative toxin-antitoxin system toxin component, PIN family [Silvibacterium bohemicum]MBB6145488.1 putative PIN family toxin of toxin-antitoxin system [Silvibacterium bohemicum]
MKPRVVFDTTTVISALLFRSGKLSWLRDHWRENACVPLLSRDTAAELTRVLAYPKFHLLPELTRVLAYPKFHLLPELTRVLAYPKFHLLPEDRHELLAEYLPCCKIVDVRKTCPVLCRDAKDQPFLDLAQSGKADILASGDRDLLVLAGRTPFSILMAEEYRVGFGDRG